MAKEFTIKDPDAVPTDKQMWLCVVLTRELKLKTRPKLPVTRQEASDLISSLKKKQAAS